MEGLLIQKTQQYIIDEHVYFWIDIERKNNKNNNYGLRLRDINKNLELCCKSNLDDLAKKIGIKGTYKMKKQELIELLKHKIIFE
jgi:hypothetical protein